MVVLQNTIRAAFVWLTALTTLISGAPHMTCVCPDGHVQSFCLSAYPGLSGCCCCARHDASARPNQLPPCCQGRVRHRPGGLDRLESPRCHKTLTPSSVVATPPAPDGVYSVGAPDALPFLPSFTAVAGAGLCSRTVQRPPGASPGNLVVSLQRLVI